jgi:hypothetical protein
MITAIKGRSADENQTRGEEAQTLHCIAWGRSREIIATTPLQTTTAVDGTKRETTTRTKGRGRVTSPLSVGQATVNSAASDPLSPLLVLAGSLA